MIDLETTDPRTGGALDATLSLWDWRRRVGDLYDAVRAAPTPEEGWLGWYDGRDRLFRDHPQSPLTAGARARFRGLPVFRYDPALRFAVSLGPVPNTDAFDVPVGHDGILRMRPFARTTGLADAVGGELTLYWLEGYGGGVFLPFVDATAGTGTYGGGRYLLDTIKGADLGRDAAGRAIVDFNFAYNPSCAYSDLWVCPLAPAENRIPRRIEAGEQVPAG